MQTFRHFVASGEMKILMGPIKWHDCH